MLLGIPDISLLIELIMLLGKMLLVDGTVEVPVVLVGPLVDELLLREVLSELLVEVPVVELVVELNGGPTKIPFWHWEARGRLLAIITK